MALALKTLAAIDKALLEDQGNRFRGILRELMPLAEDAYESNTQPWRSHLGASLLGRECSRELWYSFHWSILKKFEGRMIRLFNRGHLEEPRMVALLKMIGYQVWQFNSNGKQFRVDGYKNHAGGGIDAVVRGVLDIPEGENALGEFKTHNDDSFQKLKQTGVFNAKPEHFVQMQTYMGKLDLKYALYVAVNKNNDELHAEIIHFDQKLFDRYQERSRIVIDSKVPLPKLPNASASWYKCKFCDYNGICNRGETPVKNCRTCQFSEVGDNGTWVCQKTGTVLSKTTQMVGCDAYTLNPVYFQK